MQEKKAIEQHPAADNTLTEKYIDLAAAGLGGMTLAASDEFFAEKENLLKPGRGIFIADKYTDKGKWMDGWESRRGRTQINDWCIIRLALPGKVHAIDIDTNHFLGNHPPFASVEATAAENVLQKDIKWHQLLAKSLLQAGSQNVFPVENNQVWRHLRLNIFPDGGVARFCVYGEVHVDWDWYLPGEPIDLAALVNGGRVIRCSDMFFSDKNNLIKPDPGRDMGDGWETKRKRQEGNDWVILQLGAVGSIHKVEVDTRHFKGNYPESCSLEGTLVESAGDVEGREPDETSQWTEILPPVKLQGHYRHFFREQLRQTQLNFSHVRLNIYPDGGISRLRLHGYRPG